MKIDKAINKVLNNLEHMPEGELKKMLKSHKMGIFGRSLLECGYIDTIMERRK